MNPLQSLPEYERFIYTLPQRYPIIRRSTLIVIRRGTATAVLTGEVELGGYRLVVREKLSFAQTPGIIKGYGYEVWRGEKKLYQLSIQEPSSPSWVEAQSHWAGLESGLVSWF